MATLVLVPTTFSGTDNTNGGSITWANPENVAASDDSQSRATGPLFAVPAVLTSLTLKVGTFMSGGKTLAQWLSANDTITSITMAIERNANGEAVGWYVKDAIVQQFYGAAYAGTNLADTINEWDGPPSGVSVDYAWSVGLPTTAQVRAADYALGVQVTMLPLTDADIYANIDYISMTLVYTKAFKPHGCLM